jgi:DNA-directed RNA polymerase specialized sigma24 family protein
VVPLAIGNERYLGSRAVLFITPMSAVLQPQHNLVSDADLLGRLSRRDSTALIELERRHRNSLYAQVYAIVMDSALSDRVVNTVFTELWQSAGQAPGRRSAFSWLRRMAAELARTERVVRESHLRRIR